MSENKKVFFIINKFSGTGYRPDVEGKIIAACGKLGLECTLEFTQHRGHAAELARLAAEQGFNVVFAVGGDGTVNEVAQGLLNTGVTMGILPKGSGNGLARHLGIPMRLSRALTLLTSTRTVMMDTLSVNGKLSVNVSGIGFDGHVAGMFGRNGHKRGLLGYAKVVLKEFRTYPEVPVTLTLNGESYERQAFVVGLANSSQFGNNARIAPHASVCDEVMDVCVVRKVPLTQFVGFARKMFSGHIDRSAFVEIMPAKKVTLKFPHAVAYHIDGEAMEPHHEFLVGVNPASLKMLLPSWDTGQP